jgi:hypothetical protein
MPLTAIGISIAFHEVNTVEGGSDRAGVGEASNVGAGADVGARSVRLGLATGEAIGALEGGLELHAASSTAQAIARARCRLMRRASVTTGNESRAVRPQGPGPSDRPDEPPPCG